MKISPYCTQEQLDAFTYPTRLDGMKLIDWMRESRAPIVERLRREGVVLMRGLSIISSGQFASISSALFGDELLSYTNRSTPRTELKGNIYTSTEYPKEESIPQHNENAYSHEWPMKIAFMCLIAAEEGGATPVADSRKVYRGIDAAIREKFERKGVMYLRNYKTVGLPWQEVFQVDTKEEVNAYCERHGIDFEWVSNDHLRTRQRCPAVSVHPYTGETVWFNQAHLFHVSNHADDNRKALLQTFGEDDLPRHAYYGDGDPLEEEELEHIRSVYEREKIAFTWKNGDLMLLDNMLYSHGRDPYEGARKVLVAMAEARNWSN